MELSFGSAFPPWVRGRKSHSEQFWSAPPQVADIDFSVGQLAAHPPAADAPGGLPPAWAWSLDGLAMMNVTPDVGGASDVTNREAAICWDGGGSALPKQARRVDWRKK